MEHERIMSFVNKCLKTSITLGAVTLAAGLVGCSSTTSYSSSDAGGPVTMQSTTQPRPAPAQNAQTEPYEPRMERVSEPVPLAQGAPNEYVVQEGDTLWDISATFLKDPWYWPEIWYINPEIENPHLIYPGDVLGLVTIDGQTRITNVRASTYRMSPQARVTPLNEAISSIPFEDIAAFLSSGVVLEKSQADALPYLLETRGDHLMASAGNEVYVRGMSSHAPGTRYTIVKVGDPLVDPDDNRLIGYHGMMIGEGRLRRSGDPATVAITSSNREATLGDRFVPEEVDIPMNFFPSSPSSQIDGSIIHVVDGVSQIGQYHVVVLNRGSNNGLVVGDVLTVWQAGEVVDDRVKGGSVKMPDEQAGTIMVFKTFGRISYALVMEATQAIHIHDAVRNPT